DEDTKEQDEESFDPIPQTTEDDKDDDNNKEDQGLRIGEEERMQEEKDAEELYRDVDINQGRGLQVSQETEDTHVVSRHQTTQQYGVILPIELTNDDIRNNKVYKEYYACATGEAAPKPKASARKKKGGSASSTTPPTPIATPTPTTTVVAAPRLSAAAKDEGTGSRPGVPDVPSDDLEEDLSWNSFDDEDVGEQTKGRDKSEGDKTTKSDDDDDDQDEAEKDNDDNDDDDEEEIAKIDEQEATESGEGDDDDDDDQEEAEKVNDDNDDEEEEEESFDPILRTPEESEDDGNDEEDQGEDDGNGDEDQGLRISKEERIHEEEEADELYRDTEVIGS
nr:hypothetical protein [Tanacetum cinerariifolium]